jgi:hypothetical protein
VVVVPKTRLLVIGRRSLSLECRASSQSMNERTQMNHGSQQAMNVNDDAFAMTALVSLEETTGRLKNRHKMVCSTLLRGTQHAHVLVCVKVRREPKSKKRSPHKLRVSSNFFGNDLRASMTQG